MGGEGKDCYLNPFLWAIIRTLSLNPYRVASKINAGENQVKEISMAKNFACRVSDKVTFDAVQIFGGYGYMRGYLVERLYRDNRILSIGGGTTEIMNEVISGLIF